MSSCLARWICACKSAERGLGVAIADAALFADLIASGKVVRPFNVEVDSVGTAISSPIRLSGGSSGIFGCLRSGCWLWCGGEGVFYGVNRRRLICADAVPEGGKPRLAEVFSETGLTHCEVGGKS